MKIGKVFVTETNSMNNPKFIINFPTKKHWKFPSKISYIEDGLISLKDFILTQKISSVAIPPLGRGNGKLNWNIVKPLIINSLKDTNNIDVVIYEPLNISLSSNVSERKKRIILNPVRAMVLTLFDKY
jgi:O-acetyl-ADP-ribose deacetylase (regulator of RNase III)